MVQIMTEMEFQVQQILAVVVAVLTKTAQALLQVALEVQVLLSSSTSFNRRQHEPLCKNRR